jgi:excisionase family DNA binding protein
MQKTKSKRGASSAEELANSQPVAAYRSGEAAGYLKISLPTLHREVKAGKLRPCRQVRHLRFLKSELDRWLIDGMA